LLGGFLAHFLYGLTDAVALGAKPGILFWMLLGLSTGLFASVQPDPGSAGNISTEATAFLGRGDAGTSV
jgi:hypothetical protein